MLSKEHTESINNLTKVKTNIVTMTININGLNSYTWKTKPINILSQDLHLEQRKESIRIRKDKLANTSYM